METVVGRGWSKPADAAGAWGGWGNVWNQNDPRSVRMSVAMCTYNGMPYVTDQLSSFLRQERRPDELIVCDDGSTDGTLATVKDFSERAPFPVQIHVNATRLGVAKNFEKAILLCSGDIIVLSDQDDVWLPSKLRTLEMVLTDNPEAGYAFSDGVVVDEHLRPVGATIWGVIKFGRRERRRFGGGRQVEVLLRRNVVTGATMAFQSELRPQVFPIPEGFVHDAWIALAASAMGRRGILVEAPLIWYRRHVRQAIGVGRSSWKAACGASLQGLLGERLREAECFERARARLLLLGRATGGRSQRLGPLLSAKVRHLRARAATCGPSGLRGLAAVATELGTGRYFRFSRGVLSACADVLRVLRVVGVAGRSRVVQGDCGAYRGFLLGEGGNNDTTRREVKDNGNSRQPGSKPASSPLVCSVVLNWNGWRDTIECLETLRFQTSPVHRLVVVDNGSTDDSLYRVKAWARGELVLDSQDARSKQGRVPMVLVEYDQLTAEAGGVPEAEIRLAAVPPEQRLVLVTTGQNLGFAGGMNVGIRYACALGSDYVWLINNDTVIAPDALAVLLKAAEGRPGSGLLGPVELDYFKPDRVVDSVGVVRPWRGVIGGATTNVPLNEQGHASVELLSGFCVLARCEAIQAVGLMDDRFFLYCEDTEWCLRMRLRGWDLLHVAAARVWHKGSQSTGWGSPLMYYYTTRNQLRLFTVYFPYAVPAAMARTAARAVKLAIGGRWRECSAVVRGFGHWIRGRFGRFPEDPHVES